MKKVKTLFSNLPSDFKHMYESYAMASGRKIDYDLVGNTYDLWLENVPDIYKEKLEEYDIRVETRIIEFKVHTSWRYKPFKTCKIIGNNIQDCFGNLNEQFELFLDENNDLHKIEYCDEEVNYSLFRIFKIIDENDWNKTYDEIINFCDSLKYKCLNENDIPKYTYSLGETISQKENK